MNPIGIMQGRLLPPIDGRIQCFPAQQWENEFPKAAECGLYLIEWIFGPDAWDENPILFEEGIQKIQRHSAESGIKVISVCADYFMFHPLFGGSSSIRQERVELLKRLIRMSSAAAVEYIMIPFVDHSALHSVDDTRQAIEAIKEVTSTAEQYGVILTFESNLSPTGFKEMIEAIDHNSARITFDIGDRASLGYDPEEEFAAYGQYVATVHIKDRLKGGGTVPLGTGNANFEAAFTQLAKGGYEGPLIIQAAREGNETESAKRNLAFVKKYWTQALNDKVVAACHE